MENCSRFPIFAKQLTPFWEKLGKQLLELLSRGLQLFPKNRSRINSSPRPDACRHAMHSYSTAYVTFLRSAARARHAVQKTILQYCRSTANCKMRGSLSTIIKRSVSIKKKSLFEHPCDPPGRRRRLLDCCVFLP